MPQDQVSIETVRPGTLEAITKQLLSRPKGFYHLVHFDLHGTVGPTGISRSMLKFLDLATGKCKSTEASTAGAIANLLIERRVLWTVLNACKSADSSSGFQQNLARTFMQRGLHGVFAMRHELKSSRASVLMRSFYHALLVEQMTFTEAAMCARRAMRFNKTRDARFGLSVELEDWIVPVLYQHNFATFEVSLPGLRIQSPIDYPLVIGRDYDIHAMEQDMLTNQLLILEGNFGSGITSVLKHVCWWWQITRFVNWSVYISPSVNVTVWLQFLIESIRACRDLNVLFSLDCPDEIYQIHSGSRFNQRGTLELWDKLLCIIKDSSCKVICGVNSARFLASRSLSITTKRLDPLPQWSLDELIRKTSLPVNHCAAKPGIPQRESPYGPISQLLGANPFAMNRVLREFSGSEDYGFRDTLLGNPISAGFEHTKVMKYTLLLFRLFDYHDMEIERLLMVALASFIRFIPGEDHWKLYFDLIAKSFRKQTKLFLPNDWTQETYSPVFVTYDFAMQWHCRSHGSSKLGPHVSGLELQRRFRILLGYMQQAGLVKLAANQSWFILHPMFTLNIRQIMNDSRNASLKKTLQEAFVLFYERWSAILIPMHQLDKIAVLCRPAGIVIPDRFNFLAALLLAEKQPELLVEDITRRVEEFTSSRWKIELITKQLAFPIHTFLLLFPISMSENLLYPRLLNDIATRYLDRVESHSEDAVLMYHAQLASVLGRIFNFRKQYAAEFTPNDRYIFAERYVDKYLAIFERLRKIGEQMYASERWMLFGKIRLAFEKSDFDSMEAILKTLNEDMELDPSTYSIHAFLIRYWSGIVELKDLSLEGTKRAQKIFREAYDILPTNFMEGDMRKILRYAANVDEQMFSEDFLTNMRNDEGNLYPIMMEKFAVLQAFATSGELTRDIQPNPLSLSLCQCICRADLKGAEKLAYKALEIATREGNDHAISKWRNVCQFLGQ
ncbi:hypothetical protein K440DRAFT_635924 [Wilcoxina mikolae CBS 423.85]|nr:hypothetical protein K440DRAFT_635924 [Wilcoxina mikolae CBS 423.85]